MFRLDRLANVLSGWEKVQRRLGGAGRPLARRHARRLDTGISPCQRAECARRGPCRRPRGAPFRLGDRGAGADHSRPAGPG